MKLRTLLIITAVVSGLFGIAMVLFPDQLHSTYGSPEGALSYDMQLWGSALITIAVISWMSRNVALEAQKVIVLALFIGNVIAFVLALLGQINHVLNAFGWSNVVIYLLLALGYGYFQFLKPTS